MRHLTAALLGTLTLALALPAQAGQLTLTWTDNATNEQGFEIERCPVAPPASACTAFTPLAVVGQAQGSGEVVIWADLGLPPGAAYCYRVRAYNTAGASAYANDACGTVLVVVVPPPAPTNLSVQP